MTLLIEGAAKVSVIMLISLIGSAALRRQSASLRHWILAAAVIGSLVVPVFGAIVPRWRVAVEPPTLAQRLAPARPRASTVVTPEASAPVSLAPPAASAASGADLARRLLDVWLAGTIVGALLLLVGLVRLGWLARRARQIPDARWTAMATEIAGGLRLGRPVVLLTSERHDTLMTWGARRPTIMIPADGRTWSDDRIRIVLSHELAHVQRADWFIQIAAECLRIAYWFNPLVWLACRRLRRESEHACDDAVLALGVRGTDYAAELVEFARSAGTRRQSWLPAAAMAQASSLERRVTAMLNTTLNRRPVSGGMRSTVMIGALMCAVAITGLTVSSQTFSSVAGSIFDATNRVLPNVTLKLTNAQTGAEYTIRSDPSGRYEFVGLPLGEYAIRAQLPGFATMTGRLVLVASTQTNFDVRLEVGSIEETVLVIDGVPPQPPRGQLAPPKPPCQTVVVGGNIRAPRQIRRVEPVYPTAFHGTGHDEVVVLQAVIGADGTTRDVTPVGTPTPEFASAAVEAVRQWAFSETLLNCEPVEVRMNVTAHFRQAPPPPPPPLAGRAHVQFTPTGGRAHIEFPNAGAAVPVLN